MADEINAIEIYYQTQISALEIRITILLTTLVLMSIVLVIIFFQYKKNRRSRIHNHQKIEEQQRSNDQIMQMLEQKKREVEQQSLELHETSTELKWQTENALRLYDEVEQQRKEMTDSILYAKRIQTILLPEKAFVNEILNDYFVLFQPRDIVSGDFYWISAKKEKTLVAVADCTGHGVPGAFMSIMGINFLNTIVQNENLHADIILNQMREQVINSLKQTGKVLENKDGMDMAFCIIDWENAKIEYAGANIPLILLRSTPESPHELIEIRADRMPIGIYELAARPFTRHTIPIIPGDSIYMFSDGYCDQFGGPDLKKFKKKNLTRLLSEIHVYNMTEQRKRLKRNLDKWRGELPQVDDILMLGIKI
jgi:serine phosphatase RsbU (regulator of sigma subunit)